MFRAGDIAPLHMRYVCNLPARKFAGQQIQKLRRQIRDDFPMRPPNFLLMMDSKRFDLYRVTEPEYQKQA